MNIFLFHANEIKIVCDKWHENNNGDSGDGDDDGDDDDYDNYLCY